MKIPRRVTDGKEEREFCEGNAQAISAVPNMIMSIEMFTNLFNCPFAPTKNDINEALLFALAAITKAKGLTR